jgi:regulation of enolase protein 1 (concanavalin A-like superfamily)
MFTATNAGLPVTESAGSPQSSSPSPWASTDVGDPVVSGWATIADDAVTVIGGGADIWDYWDQFHFVYQPVNGNTDIIVQVADLQAADEWTKAGIMIREALTGSAAHAFMFHSGANGRGFVRRYSDWGMSYYTPSCPCSAPGWLRLVRDGDQFSAYESYDGVYWTLVGTESIWMPPTVYVGLAVTSRNPYGASVATFTNLTVATPTPTPTPSNVPPAVVLLDPISGSSFTAPATFAIAASATDIDGVVARVDFYQGDQLVGSATTEPFRITWYDVTAGTYSLTAVATDDGGATSWSAPVTLTVTNAVPADEQRPTTLIFTPAVDHETNVHSYTLELRRDGDLPSAEPIATTYLGKPTIIYGEIALDISAIVDALPSGAYYAVVIGIGPGGATPSDPSATFWR